MKGHMLRHVGTFKVGEIATAVPPGSAILLNGALGVIDTANREIGVPGQTANLGVMQTANLVNGVIQTANREIGVPGIERVWLAGGGKSGSVRQEPDRKKRERPAIA